MRRRWELHYQADTRGDVAKEPSLSANPAAAHGGAAGHPLGPIAKVTMSNKTVALKTGANKGIELAIARGSWTSQSGSVAEPS